MHYPSYHVPQSNLRKGVSYILLAYLFMALFGIMTKIATKESSPLLVSFFAYLCGFIILLPFAVYYRYNPLDFKHIGLHVGRAFFGLSASILYFLSLQKISIVNATLLFNTAPIFIPIFAIFWWHQKISLKNWYAIALGFLGIILIIHPTQSIFKHSGNLIGLASGISLAIAYMFVKELTYFFSPIKIIFYFFALSTLMQIPFMLLTRPTASLAGLGYAAAAGCFFIIAQAFLVKAYQYAEASKIGVFQYSSVVFVGLFDWLLWDQIPTHLALLGTLLVMIAGGLVIRGTHVKEMHPAKKHVIENA